MMFKNKQIRRVFRNSIFSLLTFSTAVSTACADGLPTAKKHMFMASDETRLVADVYEAKGDTAHPCVILVHQLGKSKADMVPLVAPLLAQGFTVVNLDMRGHGSSQGKKVAKIPYTSFTNADWAKLPGDLRLVVTNIITAANIDVQKLALVGASISANAAVMEARNATNIQALVLLSPGLDFHGLQPGEDMKHLRQPTLVVAAKDDAYSADSGAKLSKMEKNSTLDLLPQGGHGSQMFASHPELPKQIATWLHKAMH